MKMFIITILGGWFGLHKFVTGKKVMGLLYLFTGGLCGIGWIVDSISALYKYIKAKPQKEINTKSKDEGYYYLTFKVAGVTFNNGRKTRQAILRAFRWGDEIIETVTFEPYIYEGKNAVYVKLNSQIVGNIPSDTTETFIEYNNKYILDNATADVYGGSKLDDGSRTNYGCEIHIRFRDK